MPAVPRRILSWLGALAALGLILAMALWVPVDEVLEALSRVAPSTFVAAMLLVVPNLWLRGFRWALLFRPHHRVTGASASKPVWIGLSLNAVLPGRIGEVARIVLGSRRFGTSLPYTTATVLIDRLLDALTLLGFFGIAVALLPDLEGEQRVAILGTELESQRLFSYFRRLAWLCLAAAGLTVTLLFPSPRALARKVWRALPGGGLRAARWLARQAEDSARALDALGSPVRVGQMLLLGFAIWTPLILANYLIARAFPELNLRLSEVVVVTAVTIGMTSLPSLPGAWGVFEAGGVLTLVLLGVPAPPPVALAYLLVIHCAAYFPVVLGGGAAVLWEGIGWKELRSWRR